MKSLKEVVFNQSQKWKLLNNAYLLAHKIKTNIYNGMSDEVYLRMMYKKKFQRDLDLKNPQSFNEKIQWLKLNDRKSIYTKMVDKFEVKSIIKDRLGESFTFEFFGSWIEPNEINLETLPNQFVLKANHAGGIIICRDKKLFNIEKAKEALTKQLSSDYYLPGREWPYKDVKRKVIAEKYMGEELIEYKIYCFNGEPKLVYVWRNVSQADGSKPSATFCGAYDTEWSEMPFRLNYAYSDEVIEEPIQLYELLRCARIMSQGIPFVRVDCYLIDSQVYIGEMTFSPWAGFMKYEPDEWDFILGSWLTLPGKRA